MQTRLIGFQLESYRAAGDFDDDNQLELCEFMKDCHLQRAYGGTL